MIKIYAGFGFGMSSGKSAPTNKSPKLYIFASTPNESNFAWAARNS